MAQPSSPSHLSSACPSHSPASSLAVLVVPGIVGTTDAGIETVSAGAVAGAVGSANPMDFQPESLPIPNRLAVVCWLSGVGVVGLASVVIFY